MAMQEVLQDLERIELHAKHKRSAVMLALKKLDTLDHQRRAHSRWPLEQKLEALRLKAVELVETRRRRAEAFEVETRELTQAVEAAIEAAEADLRAHDQHAQALDEATKVLEVKMLDELRTAIRAERAAEAS